MDCQQWREQQSAFPGMGSLFSMAQWQELELQALIYQYMMAEASVPLDLILSLKRSFVAPSPCYFYHHFQPSMVQTGYWGQCLVDPEPRRCRRTDGKKWRCSREVVTGHKYCDRHVHRGRNRSRKHVETTTTCSKNGYKATTLSPMKEKKETHFPGSGSPPPLNIIPLNQGPLDDRRVDGSLQGKGSNNPSLMRFFDCWPKTEKESASSSNNATLFSISTPENSSPDFSLKLSTGNRDCSGFENQIEASTMGGPLAEALRSSISLTGVLQKLNGSSCSDTSCASV